MPRVILAIGLYPGDLLRVLDQEAPNTKVLALEPGRRAADLFTATELFAEWQRRGRLTYLTGPDYVGWDRAWRVVADDADSVVTVVDPRVGSGPQAHAALKLARKILFGARANADARRTFAPRYLLNTLRNATAIASGGDVNLLADQYRGVPAIVAAAGPSLDRCVEEIAAAANSALIVAVDTATRPLAAAGIAPHLVVGLDPGEDNARHFRALPPLERTWLVSESALDPSAAAHFRGRTLWFRVAQHEPWPWLQEHGVDVAVLDVWGSVLTAAFRVALLAGCTPIVFAGADLAFSGGQPYCRGTANEYRWTSEVARGADLDEIWRWTTTGSAVPTTDLNDRPIWTTPALLSFRDWLVTEAGRCGRRIINAGGTGILRGAAVEHARIADAVAPVPPIPVVGDVLGCPPRRPGREFLAALGELAHAIESTPHALFEQWNRFAAGGLSPESVRGALQHSAQHETAPVVSPPGVPPVGPWLFALPEGMRRWRAFLAGSGTSAEAAPGGVVRADAALTAALDILGALARTDSAQIEESESEPLPAAPLSARLDLPVDIAWSLLTYEGLLGRACGTKAFAPADSFFGRSVLPRAGVSNEPAGSAPEGTPSVPVATVLAIEWAMCVASLSASDRERETFATDLRACVRQLRSCPDGREVLPARLQLELREAGRVRGAHVDVAVDPRGLARVDTGLIVPGAEGAASRGLAVEVHWNEAPVPCSAHVTFAIGAGAQRHIVVRPRVLTDEGLPPVNIAYDTVHGVVCVSPGTRQSLMIERDGRHQPWHEWPTWISGELPFGNQGFVAWSRGDAAGHWPRVMWRLPGEQADRIERLPFRPSKGAWWAGRLYWTCTGGGIGACEFGGEAKLTAPTIVGIAIEADADGLLISTGEVDPNGVLIRRRSAVSWRWTGTREPVPVPLGRFGAATSTSHGPDGWTAIVYPESDLIQLLRDDRAFSMTCHHPYRAAWLATSLLVSTMSGELLLFENLTNEIQTFA